MEVNILLSLCFAVSSSVSADKTNYLRQLFTTESVCLKHKGRWHLQRSLSGSKYHLQQEGGAGCYRVCS